MMLLSIRCATRSLALHRLASLCFVCNEPVCWRVCACRLECAPAVRLHVHVHSQCVFVVVSVVVVVGCVRCVCCVVYLCVSLVSAVRYSSVCGLGIT